MTGRSVAAHAEPVAVYPHHLGGACYYFRSEAAARAFADGRSGCEVAETSPGLLWRVWERRP